jgi:hypothetical protein
MATYALNLRNAGKPHTVRVFATESPDGKQHQYGFATKTEAYDFLARFEQDAKVAGTGRETFSQAFAAWLESHPGSVGTRDKYQCVYNTCLNDLFGDRKVADIARDDRGVQAAVVAHPQGKAMLTILAGVCDYMKQAHSLRSIKRRKDARNRKVGRDEVMDDFCMNVTQAQLDIATALGRDGDQIRFLPALVPVVAPTEQEAEDRWEHLQSRLPPAPTEAARLEAALGLVPGVLDGDLDSPLAPAIFDHSRIPHEGFGRAAGRFAAETGYSAREFARHISGGHRLVIGSPQQVADHIEEWWRAGAVDGFTIAPPALVHDLQGFVDLVVPELQRRGIYRDRYPGRTLRANLGLPVPANPFAALVNTAK